MASLWIRRCVVLVAAAVAYAAAVGYVCDLQAATLKKTFSQMRYFGGPKALMWHG
jgi:hypothetical protein